MKTIKYLLFLTFLAVTTVRAEEWRRVAFVGEAKVKTISGLVEVLDAKGEQHILHAGEPAHAGQTLRVWRGAEVVLWMEKTKSFVRVEGPVFLRLMEDHENFYRTANDQAEDPNRFEVRAVRGGAKAFHNGRWCALQAGMNLPEGTKVRPFRESIVDLYHPASKTAFRITDHTKQTTLTARQPESAGRILAAQAP